jgi:TRAP-type C4-dicarboxylate transport system permease small subunit
VKSGSAIWAGRVLKGLFWIEATVAVSCFTVVVVSLLADVKARELFGNGIFAAQRVAVYATAIAGLLGYPIVVGTGGHIRPSVLDALVPQRWSPLMDRIADVTSATICLGFAYFCVLYVESARELGERQMVLNNLVWPLQTVMPWLFVSAAVRYLIFACFPAYRPAEEAPAQ